ncbi:MAG TPA: potassium/proton antiporter [Stellaceae bacterium]|nr:potassium/proton antiporter [Stellaceae bacterium]
MQFAHELILLGGALGLASLFAGLASARFGVPSLLVFVGLGMLAGEDGPGGIDFNDFESAYLIGSIALVVILFEGGIKTDREKLRTALWPALALGTIGVVITAAIAGAAGVLFAVAPWRESMLVGAAVAPTDAAAVAALLRRTPLAVPKRLLAVLEVESGLNDPVSVLMTVMLVEALVAPEGLSVAKAALTLLEEVGGGVALGIGSGAAMVWLLRRLSAEIPLFPVLALTAALAVFGLAQVLGASGFLAVFLMGVAVGTSSAEAAHAIERFFEALASLAEIALFLILGLLVTPHDLVPVALPSLAMAAALILVARPVATALCLLPFRFGVRETAFASWVGLRGAVPIYLTMIPVIEGAESGEALFGIAFVIVLTSLLVQGGSIGTAARLLGFGATAVPTPVAGPGERRELA